MRRLFADSSGQSAAVDITWWPEGDLVDGRPWVGGAACLSVTRSAGLELCVADSVGAPYAANRLTTLGTRGVWTLPGDATPPDTAPCDHLCMSPGWLVVEAREGRRYRTYGYGLPSPGGGTEPRPHSLLSAY